MGFYDEQTSEDKLRNSSLDRRLLNAGNVGKSIGTGIVNGLSAYDKANEANNILSDKIQKDNVDRYTRDAIKSDAINKESYAANKVLGFGNNDDQNKISAARLYSDAVKGGTIATQKQIDDWKDYSNRQSAINGMSDSEIDALAAKRGKPVTKNSLIDELRRDNKDIKMVVDGRVVDDAVQNRVSEMFNNGPKMNIKDKIKSTSDMVGTGLNDDILNKRINALKLQYEASGEKATDDALKLRIKNGNNEGTLKEKINKINKNYDLQNKALASNIGKSNGSNSTSTGSSNSTNSSTTSGGYTITTREPNKPITIDDKLLKQLGDYVGISDVQGYLNAVPKNNNIKGLTIGELYSQGRISKADLIMALNNKSAFGLDPSVKTVEENINVGKARTTDPRGRVTKTVEKVKNSTTTSDQKKARQLMLVKNAIINNRIELNNSQRDKDLAIARARSNADIKNATSQLTSSFEDRINALKFDNSGVKQETLDDIYGSYNAPKSTNVPEDNKTVSKETVPTEDNTTNKTAQAKDTVPKDNNTTKETVPIKKSKTEDVETKIGLTNEDKKVQQEKIKDNGKLKDSKSYRDKIAKINLYNKSINDEIRSLRDKIRTLSGKTHMDRTAHNKIREYNKQIDRLKNSTLEKEGKAESKKIDSDVKKLIAPHPFPLYTFRFSRGGVWKKETSAKLNEALKLMKRKVSRFGKNKKDTETINHIKEELSKINSGGNSHIGGQMGRRNRSTPKEPGRNNVPKTNINKNSDMLYSYTVSQARKKINELIKKEGRTKENMALLDKINKYKGTDKTKPIILRPKYEIRSN